MPSARRLVLIAALWGFGLPVAAADFSDPTWPCVQRKVENLSMGLMWPGEVDREATKGDEALAAEVEKLADYLSLRRVELEEARPRVEDFVTAHEGQPEALGLVFARVFDTLNTRRTRIIEGIAEFSLSQIGLAEKIEAARAEMDTQMAKEEPDYDRVDALEEQIDWDQRIFDDRQQSITYLCETPTLLERRLFGIAQMLQQAAAG